MSQWVLGPGDLDNFVFIPAIIFGFIVLCVYVCRCRLRRCKFEEFIVISIFLGSAGFISGAVLMINTVIASLTSRQTPLALYTFIAGLSVSIVSAKGLCLQIFKDVSQNSSECLHSKNTQPQNPAEPKKPGG